MIRPIVGCLGVLAIVGPSKADVADSVTYENVSSVSFLGDPANELHFFAAAATEPFTLGAMSWDGLGTPTENPDGSGGGQFPTFGVELRARVRHENSGESADIWLGNGFTFGPDPTPFVGSSYGLSGTVVQPGDMFSFEFFEDFDDPEVNPDATWNSISLHLHDDVPGPDVIRFDTTGEQTWPTGQDGFGADYFGIEYGAGGTGPSITNIRLEGHGFTTFWFDLRTDLDIEDFGQFRTSRLRGVSEPQVTFSDEDPTADPDTGELLFANTFGTLELAFEEGDFGPGDLIRFGVLVQNADFGDFELGQTRGDQMAQLQESGPLSVTVTFNDATKVTAPLLEPNPDLPDSAHVDLSLLDRAQPSGGDTDGDGDVDGNDLLHAFVGFGTRFGALPADGDVDGQGDVDDDDLAIVVSNLGTGIVPLGTALPPAASVPEPTGFAMLLLGTAIACRWRRLKKKRMAFCSNTPESNVSESTIGG